MYERKDPYYRRAKREGYRSRAAYKLSELSDAAGIARRGDRVIDAGAAPGGWSQVLLERVGTGGRVAAVDLLPMEPLPGEHFRFFRSDLSDPALPGKILGFLGGRADAVVSDAAPNTTGIPSADQARSAELVRAVARLAGSTLRPGGCLLAKVFEGPDVPALLGELRREYRAVRRLRPAATRRESFEVYLFASGFRGGAGG